MRRFVNGDEVELNDDAEVVRLPDRLMVRTAEGAFSALVVKVGDAVLVSYQGRQYRIERRAPRVRSAGSASTGELRAPMPGAIVDVLVTQGTTVSAGEVVLVLEAMKTQQPFKAPFDGIVKSLDVTKGDQVQDGQLLAVIEAIVNA